jgi:hypothetical protein
LSGDAPITGQSGEYGEGGLETSQRDGRNIVKRAATSRLLPVGHRTV